MANDILVEIYGGVRGSRVQGCTPASHFQHWILSYSLHRFIFVVTVHSSVTGTYSFYRTDTVCTIEIIGTSNRWMSNYYCHLLSIFA